MKLGAVRGLAQDQALTDGDVGRACVTSMAVAGGAHEPRDAVLRQRAIGESVTDTRPQNIVVHKAFSATSWCHAQFT